MLKKTPRTYPLSILRAVALHTQKLDTPHRQDDATSDSIYEALFHIGAVQLDTLQMVHRSHYVAMWSRMGTYNRPYFDELIYGQQEEAQNNTRRLFEYWLHAACIIPLADYRYLIPQIKKQRAYSTGMERWLAETSNAEMMAKVYERIHEEGPLRSQDFEYKGEKRGSWWDWKPAKRALEYLYNEGKLMIANRTKFQRHYDLTERVLPDWVDITEPTEGEMHRFWLERGAKALGVCEAKHAANYTHMKLTPARPIINKLIKEKVFVEIEGELADGSTKTLIIHRDNMHLLQQAADGEILAKRTTFLSPFDSLWWAQGRDIQFWNFEQTLEAYKPAPIRKWGYFCLPILHKDRLIGRFDPKLERKKGALRLKNLHLEPDVVVTDEMVADVSEAMRDFLKFHEATDVVIEDSTAPDFAKRLQAAL